MTSQKRTLGAYTGSFPTQFQASATAWLRRAYSRLLHDTNTPSPVRHLPVVSCCRSAPRFDLA